MTKHTGARAFEPQGPMVEAQLAPDAPLPPSLRAAQPQAFTAGGTEAAVQKPTRKSGRLPRVLLAGVAVLGLVGAVHFGWNYWTIGRFEIATDDAYVQADNTTIAPKVSGYVAAVLVGDNEPVKAGQPLARIDDRDFKAALDQAKADVAAAIATVAAKAATLDTQRSVITAARATVDVDQAKLNFAEAENSRYSQLAKTGYGSVQNAQHAASGIAEARASVARDDAALTTAEKQITLLKAELAQAQAMLVHSKALREQAELNLSYTTIVSPVAGVVGERTLRIGQYVQAGTQLMAVVPLAATYIVANYKETQLTDVRAGQKVDVAVDMFPGVMLHGHVDSIAPASGQEFALLPPDNATGNFTKVVQRIPVKIILDRDSSLATVLRPGMSVSPSIETKETKGQPVRAAAKRAHAG
ncbi:MAG TPA: HlyD family secretion protein [Methylovirgula sp.]